MLLALQRQISRSCRFDVMSELVHRIHNALYEYELKLIIIIMVISLLQKVCEAVVQYSCSNCALRSKQDTFLSSNAVVLELLNAPLKLRCSDGALHNLAQSSARIIERLVLGRYVMPGECGDDIRMPASVCGVTKYHAARWQGIEESPKFLRPSCSCLIMGTA